jgi:DNA polymerase-3 subunit epsilon
MPTLASPAVMAYRRTPPPAPTTPWREAEFCVIDLETTGLNPEADEIISFATLQIAGGLLRLDDAHYQLIRPRRMPDAETIRIHGLRSSDLIGAPSLTEALDGLLEALAGRAVVAHVASVECGFLDAVLKDRGMRLSNPVVDTAALAMELLGRQGRRVADPIGLSALARALDLPVHRPHHADGDALTAAQVFLALAAHLDALEPQTVGSLQQYGSRAPRGSGRPALRRVLTRLTRDSTARGGERVR